MRFFYLLSLGALLLSAASTANAQRRTVGNLALLPTVQAELALTGDDYVYGSFGLLRYTGQSKTLNTFAAGQIRFGYEHFWDKQWSWGATLDGIGYETYAADVSKLDVYLTPEVFARHWNTFGSINFRQRLGVSYLMPLASDGGNSRALVSLRLDVDRVFPLGDKVALRPRLVFEPIAYLRFQRDEFEPKERVIDFAAIRGEVGMRLSPRIDFTPWFSWNSSYYFTLPQTDANGTIKIPGGRSSAVQPVLGLDVRFTLGENALNPERRQLPTQH